MIYWFNDANHSNHAQIKNINLVVRVLMETPLFRFGSVRFGLIMVSPKFIFGTLINFERRLAMKLKLFSRPIIRKSFIIYELSKFSRNVAIFSMLCKTFCLDRQHVCRLELSMPRPIILVCL